MFSELSTTRSYLELSWVPDSNQFKNWGTSSVLQEMLTTSPCNVSTEQYISLCSEVCEVRYLWSLLHALGFKQRESTVIWEDNRSTILIIENECSSAGRSKHIDIRFKFVAQTIPQNIVRVHYTPTETTWKIFWLRHCQKWRSSGWESCVGGENLEIITVTRTYNMNALCVCMMLILGWRRAYIVS